MAKTLRVIDSFFVMEFGDTFVLSEDGSCYTSEHNEEFYKDGEGNELRSAFNSKFVISLEYAKQLIKDGYLEEVDPEPKKTFVNVFDEIDTLINKYQIELDNIDNDLINEPQCVKVEKTTVLTNILSVLNHLKNLRK
jgi:hypothetical protein